MAFSREMMPARSSTVRSVLLFGAVGAAASAVHAAMGIALVRGGVLAPFAANVVAFLTAFAVSYFGHRNWSFRSDAAHGNALPKFFAIALAGLAFNQIIVYGIVNRLGQTYELALAVVFLTVPPSTYVLARLWAFGRTRQVAQ